VRPSRSPGLSFAAQRFNTILDVSVRIAWLLPAITQLLIELKAENGPSAEWASSILALLSDPQNLLLLAMVAEFAAATSAAEFFHAFTHMLVIVVSIRKRIGVSSACQGLRWSMHLTVPKLMGFAESLRWPR